MGLNLRSYQNDLKYGVYESFKNHDNVIAWLQTGGGKTITFMSMIRDFQQWGMNVVVIMRRKSLVNQTYPIMDNFGIEHGVYMAKHHRYSPSKTVQLCSIDTLGARNIFPHSEDKNTVVIIDESHDCTPSGKKYARVVEAYKGCKIVGFTATPFSDNSFFKDLVNPISAIELLNLGFLTPAKAFVPNLIDTSNVKINTKGQFDQDSLFEACSGSKVVGNIVDDWFKYGNNKRTILFAVNIEHSKLLCEAFRARGVAAVHCDKDTKDKDRKRIIQQVRDGEVTVLCNVNVFSTGLDLVEIETIVFARPTRSEIFFLQAIGRGLRPAPEIGKTHCTVIDSAGNWLRFGSPFKQREVILGTKPRVKDDLEDIQIRTCKQCFYIFKATDKICPECGFTNPKIERKGFEEVDGELVEIQLSEEEIESIKLAGLKKKVNQLFWVQKKNSKLSIGFVGHQLEKDYGKEYIDKNFLMINSIITKLMEK